MKTKIRTVGLYMLILVILVGCSSADKSQTNSKEISIAEQYGLAYAPLQIMREMQILEEKMPELKVNWKQLGNTAAIREAMIAGEVDAGFMAIPPFLIGWDKGMQWKIATGLSLSPVGLVTSNPQVKSLKDFTDEDRIALPQPGSVQHILLSMKCLEEFGDASKFDNQLVTLSHPDGMNALMSNTDVTAHFTSPPYLYYELEKGMNKILDGNEIMDSKFSFIIGVTTNKFHENNKEIYDAFLESVEEAILFINNNPEKAAQILSESYNIPEEELVKYLTWEGNEYTTKVYGFNKFAEFMQHNKTIDKASFDIGDVMWDDVDYEN